MRKRDKKKERKELLESYSFVTQFSINMIVPILLCTMIGVYVDRYIGFSFAPVIGFVIGAASGYTSIYRMVKKRLKRDSEDEKHY